MPDLNFLGDMSSYVYHVVDMPELMKTLLAYQQAKDGRYRRSWAKRGLIGYWTGAIGRQIDRVDENFDRVVSNNAKELDVLHLLDTLVDVGLYALMGVCLLATYFPGHYKKFMERIQEEIDGAGLSDVRLCSSESKDG